MGKLTDIYEGYAILIQFQYEAVAMANVDREQNILKMRNNETT